jgi:hypothetical protein
MGTGDTFADEETRRDLHLVGRRAIKTLNIKN